MKINKINLSVTKAIGLLETIYEIEFTLPDSQKIVRKLVNLRGKHKVVKGDPMLKSGEFKNLS